MSKSAQDPTHLFEMSDGVYLMSARTTSPARRAIRKAVRGERDRLQREKAQRDAREDSRP